MFLIFCFCLKDCDLNQCRRIQCTIREMIENTEVIFEIQSRPWNQTLRHISISKFPVTSVLIARITSTNFEFDPDLLLPIAINVTTIINLVGGHLDVIIPLKSLVTAVFIGLTLLGLLIIILIRLDFFKREPMEYYERKQIDDSIASNSLIDHQQHYNNELLDRHLKSSRQFTKTNSMQKGRLLRKRNLIKSTSADRLDRGSGSNRTMRRQTKHYEYHNELTSSGGELHSSTYEEYRHLEEDIDEIDEDDSNLDDEEQSSEESNETTTNDSSNKIDETTTDDESNNQTDNQSSNQSSSSQSNNQSNSQTSNNTDEETSGTLNSRSDQTEQTDKERVKLKNKQSSSLIYEDKLNKSERIIYKKNLASKESVNNVNRSRLHTPKYNEKLYDKLHYKRNNQFYTFYKDTSMIHERNCPLYCDNVSSRRSLVSYK